MLYDYYKLYKWEIELFLKKYEHLPRNKTPEGFSLAKQNNNLKFKLCKLNRVEKWTLKKKITETTNGVVSQQKKNNNNNKQIQVSIPKWHYLK